MNAEVGAKVLRQEADALIRLAGALGPAFETAVTEILAAPGRVITCGVGKSGHIARKTAGTLSSTGTPSLFLHAAEAVHGDLGMVTAGDIVLLYSHTGETDEVVRLFPALTMIGAKTILITGRPESSAGALADLVLATGVTEEACPNNLAPTTSTTAMLALSDALAVAVMEARGFGREDFARFHPGGALGKRLLLRVSDVMRTGTDLACVHPETPVLDVLRAITQAGAGAALVTTADNRLAGIISDGDLRRHFLNAASPFEATAVDLQNAAASTIDPDLLAVDALEIFQNFPRKIGEIPVVNSSSEVVGILMLKDLLRSGIL